MEGGLAVVMTIVRVVIVMVVANRQGNVKSRLVTLTDDCNIVIYLLAEIELTSFKVNFNDFVLNFKTKQAHGTYKPRCTVTFDENTTI